MLPKKSRLKDKQRFQEVYLHGKFFSSGPLIIKFAPNNTKESHFGFAVGKSYSKKAVERNRMKRVLRAVVANLTSELISGFDFVISIRKPLPGQHLSVQALTETLRMILKKNNLLI